MSTYLNDSQMPIKYSVTGVLALNSIVFDFDTQEIESPQLSLAVSSVGAGVAFTVEFSSNETDWLPGYIEVAASGATAANFSAAGLYTIPKLSRFIRLRCSTAQTSGTTSLSLTKSYAAGRAINQSGVATVTAIGAAAHDAAISGNPTRVAGRALTANYTAVSTGDVADLACTTVGAQVIKPYSIPDADWQYAAAAGGIVNTTDVVAKAAGAAGIRNYVTGIHLRNSAAVATEFVIKDGSTVIFRTQLPASMAFDIPVTFPTPLRGTAATALNLACITTAAAVYANVQGYQAP